MPADAVLGCTDYINNERIDIMNKPEKLDKVIAGLKHCSLDEEGYPECKGCPYGPCNIRCGGDLHEDALEVFRELGYLSEEQL